jgi:hypothetical protein
MSFLDYITVMFLIGALLANAGTIKEAVTGEAGAVGKLRDVAISLASTPKKLDTMGSKALAEYRESGSSVAVVMIILVVFGLAFLLRFVHKVLKAIVGLAVHTSEERKSIIAFAVSLILLGFATSWFGFFRDLAGLVVS